MNVFFFLLSLLIDSECSYSAVVVSAEMLLESVVVSSASVVEPEVGVTSSTWSVGTLGVVVVTVGAVVIFSGDVVGVFEVVVLSGSVSFSRGILSTSSGL